MPVHWTAARLWATLLLTAGVVAGSGTIQAQPPAGEPASTTLPSGLRDGQPLPGTRVGRQPAARSAPAGWAPTEPPPGMDLDVTYIGREPMYQAYCVDYPGGLPILCPGTEDEPRWPAPGEVVTFTAHIVNKGTLPSYSCIYLWTIDGAPVLTSTLPSLAPGAEATAVYTWAWAHTVDGERVVDDHTVGFQVDPDDSVPETYETNNLLVDRTNALSFRFVITPEMMEAYNTPWDPVFPYSAENWLQRQVAAMNWVFANSTYPTTPGGATERVRINDITVSPTSPPWDRAEDGGWFVDADYRLVSGWYDPATDIDWALVHELSHQVGVIDLYNFNVSPSSVQVLDQDGGPVNLGFGWPRPDLMGGGDIAPHTDGHLYSSHTAGGLSSTKGYRRGYYGEYQFDIPQENSLLMLDAQGNPAPGVQVSLYQRTGPANWVGELDLDNTPEITGTTGAGGRVLLANRGVGGGVTTRTGHVLRDNPFGVVDVVGNRNIFLLDLIQGEHEEFAWLDITALNLAFWAGDAISHTLVINTHLPPPGAPPAPVAAPGRVEGDQATVCWAASPSPDVVGYYVYRAGPPYERVSGLLTDLCFTEAWGGGRVYAVTAVDGAGRESAFSNFVWAPRLLNPSALVETADGLRIVLDPQNGHALLRQRPDGRYLQNFGSVHYHLEETRFLAVDGQGRLIFSHPGDWYDSRHSVRVADEKASPLFEFGVRGSGPGEFETPAGVAVVGQPPSYEGPYEVDEHTLLLLHLDGSYDGAQGEVGAPNGTSFAAGRYDQGVLVDDADTLVYPTAGNLERTQGAVEFWLQPAWAGDDEQSYTFFEAGDQWFNRLRITKDGANNLRLMVWDSTTEYGVAYNVAGWSAGEWHHVAATWQNNSLALYVDGLLRDRQFGLPPDSLAETMTVGSTNWADQQAHAVIDEFRISDVPRFGQSSGLPYRILVADSGNHRIQVFDDLGNYVAELGSPGSGPGQFNHPQGLAAGEDGRVVVADTDNDRLQVLRLDDSALVFERVITAGLNRPVGVTLAAGGRILVADTGNNRVLVLDADGRPRTAFTLPNDGYTGAFSQPRGVLAAAGGDVVVADTGNRRVVTVRGGLLEPDHAFYLPRVAKNHVEALPACTDLIQNGGFEQDGAGWLVGVTPRPARFTAEQAHSGSRSVLLGIKPGEADVLSFSSVRQVIDLPAQAEQITLTFWMAPVSDLDPEDRQECLLLDEQGDPLAILLQGNTQGAGWTSLSYNLTAYAGRTVSLYFDAFNDGDGAGVTGFYLDDVVVESCLLRR